MITKSARGRRISVVTPMDDALATTRSGDCRGNLHEGEKFPEPLPRVMRELTLLGGRGSPTERKAAEGYTGTRASSDLHGTVRKETCLG